MSAGNYFTRWNPTRSLLIPKTLPRISLFLLVLLLASMLPAPFAAAQTDDEPFMRLSAEKGPTGIALTIRGRVLGPAGCGPLAITDSTGSSIPFGETCWREDGLFEWRGPLPREGAWLNNKYNTEIKVVPLGSVTVGFYLQLATLPTSVAASATFTIIDNTSGPYADNFPDNLLIDHFIAMEFLWAKTDQLVARGLVKRSWLWGTRYNTFLEPYAEGSNGWRYVRYNDKSRMEVTLASALLPSNPYYVTNGLLVKEMVSGQLQLGDKTFKSVPASIAPVAGDLTPANPAPIFAQFAIYLDFNPYSRNDIINRTIGVQLYNGVEPDPTYNRYNVQAVNRVNETNHFIASPFWNYLNTVGPLVNDKGKTYQGRLFEPLFYATGLPITEAYWTRSRVGGVEKDVLVQLFERRVMTYTPSNPVGFQVEMGNTGLQYYKWRYE